MTIVDTLADRLALGPMDRAEALQLVADVCTGLRTAHARGRVAGTLEATRLRWYDARWNIAGIEEARRGDERDDVRAVGTLLLEAIGSPAPLALPRDLRAPILRSLQDRADRRYATTDELARALGVLMPEPRRRPKRVTLLPALVCAAVAGVASHETVAPAAVIAPIAVAAEAPAVKRVTVARFTGEGWLGAGVTDMLENVLGERLELGDGATVTGSVEVVTGGIVVQAQIVEGGATTFADRVIIRDGQLLGGVDMLAGRLARALGAAEGPSLGALTTGSVEAYQAYIEGPPERAAALDPTFFHARAATGDLDGARALVGRAGKRGVALLERLETAERAREHKGAGRWGECVRDAEQAGMKRELAWCRLGLGDAEAARLAARAAGDAVLEGDIELLSGRPEQARAAYARVGAKARLALVELRWSGRCSTPVTDDARVEATLARACGDGPRERAAAARMGVAEPDPFGLFADPAKTCSGWLAALACTGKEAEKAGDLTGAFRAYRELLDRATGADEHLQLLHDAKRRLKAVIKASHS